MTNATIDRWDASFAIRLPADVVEAAGLHEGESVELAARDGEIVIRRRTIDSTDHSDAIRAAAEIKEARRLYSLDGTSIRELRDEGRPG